MNNRRSHFYFILTGLYAILLFVALLLPSDSLPVHKIFSLDKLWHIITYFLLAAGLIFSFHKGHFQPWFNRRWTLIIALIHASVSELLQGFSQGRTSDLADWIANCIGIGLALLLLNVFPKYVKKDRDS